MTTVSMRGMELEPIASDTVASELLLRVGTSLRAALIVDARGRIAWMDGPLTLASGWMGKAPEGHDSEEVLGPLPWLMTALHAAFSGEETVCEGDAWGQRMRALVLPVFGEGGELLGTCTRLSVLAPGSGRVAHPGELAHEPPQTRWQHEEFIHNLDGIVWEADTNFRFLFVSQQAERLLGYPVQRWMEEPDFWRTHVHPEDTDWACAFCMKATQECRPHEFEYRMVAADGSIVWLRDIVTVVSDDERPLKLRGIMVDVTEQHRVQEHLEQTVSLLQATLDSTADGVLVTDRHRKLTAFNKKFQELWHIPDALMNTRDDEQVLDSVLGQLQDPEAFLARVLELYATPEEESSEIIELRDGRVFERYSRPQRLGDTIIGRVWSFRDVTQQARVQQERERLLHDAQEAIRVRDDFLSIASHELKTPLTPLKLHLQVLKKHVATGQSVPPQHLEKALAQVGRLSSLISDLLDTSRIQAGRLDLKHEPVPLGELTREVLSDLRAASPHHTLTCEEPQQALVILGDRGRLAQVLTNLLENALKYSPMGGTIRVTLERDGTQALVSVADEGIGIPPDQRLQLFERFFRARNAPISGFGGLGLGLYICRDIVEHHGGRIWVESEVGRGSTFHFTVPLASGELRP